MTGAPETAASVTDATVRRAGYAALIGAPNAGKSTLLNRFVGTKISIVTHKVQTTRSRVLGVVASGGSQIVFVDTPGIFKPRRRLDRAMVSAAWNGAADADAVVLLADATAPVDAAREIAHGLRGNRSHLLLAINKVDAVRRESLLALTGALKDTAPFARVFMISARSGDGTADLMRYLAGVMPEGPWFFPADQMTDMPRRLLAAEITREKLFLNVHQELPYELTVQTEQWEETPGKGVRIGQVIHVRRPGHRAIVLGKGGETIKRVGTAARLELAGLLDCPVHLDLFVRVTPGWDNDPEHFRAWNLDFE